MKRIFVSSVQREFAQVRKQLKTHLSRNPDYRRLFESFVFEEDVIVTDRRTDEVYLDELAQCDLYLGIIGNEYGFEDKDGVSPTEREYDEATRLGLPRLMFVLGRDNSFRHPKEAAFLGKVSSDLIRSKCDDVGTLFLEITAALDGILVDQGAFRVGPFDVAACEGATMDDVNRDKIAWFIERARLVRNADLEIGMSPQSVFTHLQLFVQSGGGLTNAAVLLFGKDPQRFHISSEVKCVQWHGKERHKPMLSYQIYKGNLFDMTDSAVSFVLSKLDRAVGTRQNGPTAPRDYEIPQAVVAEAIINAIAHRDYASTGSVQVELFQDRLVVRNPGRINPAITKEELFEEHSSYPNNPKIAEQLYQVKYIEKFGTGFTDLLADCRAAGLPDPVIDDSRMEFTITIYRPADKAQINADKPDAKLVKDEEIVAFIINNPTLSMQEYANKLQIKYSVLRGRIAKLKAKGLRHEGPRKSGRWIFAQS